MNGIHSRVLALVASHECPPGCRGWVTFPRMERMALRPEMID